MEKPIDLYLCLSGLATAVVVTIISVMILQGRPLLWEALAWQGALMVVLTTLTLPIIEANYPKVSAVSLWLLLPIIYGLSYRVHFEFFFIYTIIWVACAPSQLSKKHSWLMLVLINLAWFGMRLLVWNDDMPAAETLLVTTFHVFALLSALTAKESAEANERTQKLNRELLATQHLLGEASRESERTRIARDLHDLLGHHLTALTINLQVAGRLSEGEAKDKIDQCYSLSKLLLSDVREAVSALREMPVVNLRELLEISIRDIPRLQINLQMENEIHLDDVNTAEALLRCVQESITNTLRHSTASQATIEVTMNAKQVQLRYTDNGGGAASLIAGNGLNGMRERLERIGGELLVSHQPTVTVHAQVPLAG